MLVKPLNSFYIVNSIENYKHHNKKLLDLIEKTPKKKYNDITYTDWKIPKNIDRPYLKYFYDLIEPKLINIGNFLKYKECEIQNTWFQQYYKNDNHDWHNHPICNFTNVYYIELPDNNKTELYDNVNKSIIDLDVKEGDLVTFPAHIIHRSKTNQSNKRKTVISFNTSFDKVDIDTINRTLTN